MKRFTVVAALAAALIAATGGAANAQTVGSGLPMPTGNVVSNGVTWRPVVSEDFTRPAALGQFRGLYANVFAAYPEGSGGGKYLTDRTVTVANGVMDTYVHHVGSVDAGMAGQIIQPDGDWAWTGGRFAMRFRADPSAAGYGAAFQLWPMSQRWAEGEMDFPEGDFGGQINLYHHRVGLRPEQNYLAREGLGAWNTWHTAVIEWVPKRSARYYLDGALVGEVTNQAQVGSTLHNWVVQTAAHSQDANGASDRSSGHLQIDWIVGYEAQ